MLCYVMLHVFDLHSSKIYCSVHCFFFMLAHTSCDVECDARSGLYSSLFVSLAFSFLALEEKPGCGEDGF